MPINFRAPKIKNLFGAYVKKLKAKKSAVYVGVLSSAKSRGEELGNAELASIHEYGTSTIPARPFLGPSTRVNAKKYAALLAKVKDINDLEKIGLQAVADVQQFIRDGTGMATLNSATVAAKGSSSPLIDTGQLLRSINFEVKK
jgi:hypothetical protein